jgi:hypothetical protein
MKMLTLAASAVLMTLTLASTAQAAIKCDGDFQNVAGSEISTPYCRDNNLAAVARSYGVGVSNSEVRNNPGTKSEVRRLIRPDIRVE